MCYICGSVNEVNLTVVTMAYIRRFTGILLILSVLSMSSLYFLSGVNHTQRPYSVHSMSSNTPLHDVSTNISLHDLHVATSQGVVPSIQESDGDKQIEKELEQRPVIQTMNGLFADSIKREDYNDTTATTPVLDLCPKQPPDASRLMYIDNSKYIII